MGFGSGAGLGLGKSLRPSARAKLLAGFLHQTKGILSRVERNRKQMESSCIEAEFRCLLNRLFEPLIKLLEL